MLSAEINLAGSVPGVEHGIREAENAVTAVVGDQQ